HDQRQLSGLEAWRAASGFVHKTPQPHVCDQWSGSQAAASSDSQAAASRSSWHAPDARADSIILRAPGRRSQRRLHTGSSSPPYGQPSPRAASRSFEREPCLRGQLAEALSSRGQWEGNASSRASRLAGGARAAKAAARRALRGDSGDVTTMGSSCRQRARVMCGHL
ncbi:hypothetical protein Dimus_024608, partial [Dionaea muscipula]